MFVGSLNFDPRSIFINSEMGLFIESAAIGNAFTATIVHDLPRTAYRVTLDDNGKLQWSYDYDGTVERYDHEPLTGWGRRASARFYSLLPIEGQL